jgi:hypothetical protein
LRIAVAVWVIGTFFWSLFLLGIARDSSILFLNLHNIKNKRGALRVSHVPLIFYYLAGIGIKFPTAVGLIVDGSLLLFHFSCQYLIPKAYEALVK